MKAYAPLFLIALAVLTSFPVSAEDDFGSRFSNVTPTGLTEKDGPQVETQPQSIEPAAGAEEAQPQDDQVPAKEDHSDAQQDPTGTGSPKPLDSE